MIDLMPDYDPAIVLGHIKANFDLSLPQARPCRAHSHKMSVAGGGPSLADTKDKLDGYICAINGSLGYLLDNGIKANACGVLDPGEHIAEMLVARQDVHYYVASMAHPKVHEKLKGCHVIQWHASGPPGAEDLLRAERPDDWFMVGGGSTMGMRWLNLGYVCGFREFHLHGLDSSYTDTTHASDDHERKQIIEINGRKTSPNFAQQVRDYGATTERFSQADMEPVSIELYGDGLLQDFYRQC